MLYLKLGNWFLYTRKCYEIGTKGEANIRKTFMHWPKVLKFIYVRKSMNCSSMKQFCKYF